MAAIPTQRVIEKLDEYLAQKDYAAAERHLQYWLADAEASGDGRGRLTVLNEQIGFYRKQEREREALEAAEAAIRQAEELALESSVVMGTTLVNAATAQKAFSHTDEALRLYERARTIYEAELSPEDGRLGGLYNNMALACMDAGRLREANALFEKALAVMEKQPNGELERAITYCNLADLTAAEKGTLDGETEIFALLEKAMSLLNTDSLPRDGYYAYVCEKCAPCFGYYGLFLYEAELKKRAESFYDGT